ncbi:hypothetical protein AB0M95_35335 [Sphaerisporangium sp. NPDC051017]|uniref:hypothetical protein n=1 Tax=Sphaerisporangium sp. NPDC051017 TaxID=3154636 RepID=UPI00344174DC
MTMPVLSEYRLPQPFQRYRACMVTRLLWEPLPESWPAAPKRQGGLRGLTARVREAAAAVLRRDDMERRVRRGAMQAIVREAYQQTLAEQDSERRGPVAFADAWKTRLAALLARDTVEVSGWSEIAIAELDTDLGWSLYAAVCRARSEAIAQAAATPSRPSLPAESQTAFHEFSIVASDEHSLGRIRYEICEPCGVGLLLKISFSSDWQFCGLGTLALRQMEARHPGLTWYTTGQYSHAKGFYERYRQGSRSPWTEKQHPCPHFENPIAPTSALRRAD